MSCASSKVRSTVHVEVRLKKNKDITFIRPDLICEDVSAWLAAHFVHLKLNQQITEYGDLDHDKVIESINVVDYAGCDSDTQIYRIQDVQLDVQAYELCESAPEEPTKSTIPVADHEVLDTSPQARITLLPNKSIDGLWDSLIFDPPIAARLLRFLTRMMTISRNPRLNLTTWNWNRLILMHGPPGSGKTTLCRALAQKLTIRMGRHFTSGKLVEINSQCLLSRWFGESGKLVRKMFNDIASLAEDEETLICVLIDEVESLTGSREKSANGNECSDSLRATNQLLTGLDDLRNHPNVVVFCTSNLISTVDSAFLDRVDIKQYVPNPCSSAIYEILRSCLNELIRAGIIVSSRQYDALGVVDAVREVEIYDDLPKLAEVHLYLWNQPQAPGRKLWLLTEKCQGLSGRTLRRLPFLAIALNTYGESCLIDEALAALSLAIDEETSMQQAGS